MSQKMLHRGDSKNIGSVTILGTTVQRHARKPSKKITIRQKRLTNEAAPWNHGTTPSCESLLQLHPSLASAGSDVQALIDKGSLFGKSKAAINQKKKKK